MPKQEHMFPAPSGGIRKDVDTLVQTAEMAREGENVMYYDGVLRPRPALTKETYDADSGAGIELPQSNFLLSTENHRAAGETITLHSVIETSNGYLLALCNDSYTNGSLFISPDDGKTFAFEAIAAPSPTGWYPLWIKEIDGYLYCVCEDNCYKADITDLPTSLTWVPATGGFYVFPIPDTQLGAGARVFHDEDNDALLIVSTTAHAVTRSPEVCAVYNLSTTFTSERITYGITFEEYRSKAGPGDWNGKHYVYGWRGLGAGTVPGDGQRLSCFPIEFNTSTGEYDVPLTAAEYYAAEQVYKITETNPGISPNVNILDFAVPTAVNYVGKNCLFDSVGTTLLFQAYNTSASDDHTIAKIAFDTDGFSGDASRVFDMSGYGTNLIPVEGEVQSSRMFFGALQSGSDYPVIIISFDNGKTWMKFENWQGVEIDSITAVTFWTTSANGRIFAVVNSDDALFEGYSQLFEIGASNSGSVIGDLHGMIQADLSDEDKAVIIGGTSGIFRLDRGDNTWTRITATDQEVTDDGGTTPWAGAGHDDEFPPLSGVEDAGVNIAGTYGEHPWVFKPFVAQGETFIIGVNGQCDPIIYHPDMAGGFARRLGYIPSGGNDPNWNAGAISPYGDPPPRAKCAVVSADRLVIANDPAGTPFDVYCSDPLDPDRGWLQGRNTQAQLADTPGEIVTMEEISALQFAVYKEDAIYHGISQVTFGISGSEVSAPFRFELSKAGVSGPCSPASVVRNFDGRHLYLARDGGVYMYDGVAPLDGGRNIRRMIQDSINLDELGKVWGMVDNKRKLVWFFYPTAGGRVNQGIVISTDQGYPWPTWKLSLPDGWSFNAGMEIRLEDDITIGDVGRLSSYGDETLASFASGQRLMLMGLANGTFFSHKWDDVVGGYNDDGIPIPVKYRSGWLTPGGVRVYTADDVYHIFRSPDVSQELLVNLYAQQISSNVRSSGTRVLSSAKKRRSTRHRVSGSQFSIELSGDLNSPFAWGGAVMRATARGDR